jgi:hypothetical protein
VLVIAFATGYSGSPANSSDDLGYRRR